MGVGRSPVPPVFGKVPQVIFACPLPNGLKSDKGYAPCFILFENERKDEIDGYYEQW